MTAILTSNTIAGRDNRAPAPAVHEDGSGFAFRMFFDQNQRIVDADTPAEVLGVLIANYPLLTVEQQREARYQLALSVQLNARGVIAANLTDEQTSALKDWEWAVLSFGEADNPDPYGWGTGEGELGVINPDVTDVWYSDVPLVLLDISYRPHTTIPAPVSIEGDYVEVKNLIWLRPADELRFLYSLSRIGYVTFGTPRATEVGE